MTPQLTAFAPIPPFSEHDIDHKQMEVSEIELQKRLLISNAVYANTDHTRFVCCHAHRRT